MDVRACGEWGIMGSCGEIDRWSMLDALLVIGGEIVRLMWYIPLTYHFDVGFCRGARYNFVRRKSILFLQRFLRRNGRHEV